MLFGMVVGVYTISPDFELHSDLQIDRFPDTGSYGSWVTLHDKV